MSLDYVSNQEIIQAAHRNLPKDIWDYLTGGAESETTMRRNRLGFDCLGLRPRVLVDVSKVDTSSTFLGQKLRIPVVCAPMFIAGNPKLVIEQCRAGVVGSFPALNARPKEALDDWLTEIETALAGAPGA